MQTNANAAAKASAQAGLYIGVMSGTSLDALDVALCRFAPFSLVATHSAAFDSATRAALLGLCAPNGVDALPAMEAALRCPIPLQSELDFFGFLSRRYSQLCKEAIDALLKKAGANASDVAAIGAHGQTVRHRPLAGFSLQLLDANWLAAHTAIDVVSDFRRRDMAHGGQGAPLAPIFHLALLEQSQSPNAQQNGARVALNLGGIANITVASDPPIGYDTGVANLLMDAWAQRHLGAAYDKDGAYARSGKVDVALLERLLQHPFLRQTPPKSTGREDFDLAYLDGALATLPPIAPQDVQATLCEFSAKSAAGEIAKYATGSDDALYVCGGGAKNGFLLARLRHHLPAWRVQTTDGLGVDPLWVEAACFAYLARQTLLGKAGNAPSVTGASQAAVLGQVCFA